MHSPALPSAPDAARLPTDLTADVLLQVGWLTRPLAHPLPPGADRVAFVPLIRWLMMSLTPAVTVAEGASAAFWRAEGQPPQGLPPSGLRVRLIDHLDCAAALPDSDADLTLWLLPPNGALVGEGIAFEVPGAGQLCLEGTLPPALAQLDAVRRAQLSALFTILGNGMQPGGGAAVAAQLRRRLEELQADREEERRRFDRTLGDLYASHSWRLTAPLRFLLGGSARHRVKHWLRANMLALPFGAKLLALRRAIVQRHGGAEGAPDLLRAKAAFRAQTAAALEAFLHTDAPLILPRAEAPEVSIVLVLWNQAELTYACLKALAAETAIPFEVVIVDNASADATHRLLARVVGATCVMNEANLGFLHAVNQAVPQCRAPRVLLLNNDAVMRPGSLAAAMATLDSAADIGAVGGRIILPNGRLQEAGSIVWRDGSCAGYGRDLPPEAGEAMFRRDVDYASGAFLLFRRQIFLELGGFDPLFAPAYYEETDFCLRLWQHGLRVVYEPEAVIDHFEFGSAQKSAAALDLQRRNRALFEQKHRAVLANHALAGPGQVLKARLRAKLRVLVIDDRVPLPSLGAGLPRAREIIAHLAQKGRFVTFYPLEVPTEDWAKTYAALPRTVEVAMGLGRPGLEAFLRARRGYYDVVLVSRPHNMAEVGRLLTKHSDLLGGARLIYDAEAVFALREVTRAAHLGSAAAQRKAEQAVAGEVQLAAPADQILTVSEAEAAHFRAAGFTRVSIVGHGVTVAPTPRAFDDRADLLFVGRLTDDLSPNVDSIQWFVRDIAPRLRALLPGRADLIVCGRADAPSLRELAGRGVVFAGEIADLRPYYDRTRVFIAPTRFAAGLPHKVHEAAAHGLPSVVTPLLADQLGWTAGEAVLTGETADAFAQAIAQLYTDPALWSRLRAEGINRVTAECSPALFAERLEALFRP